MSDDALDSVFESLADPPRSVELRSHESRSETAVFVSCSMCDRDREQAVWPADRSWNVAGISTLGNQTWERHEGERVLEGTLARIRTERDAAAVAVVGHTACAVIDDAYDRCVAPEPDVPVGIEARLGPLVSLVEEAFDEDVLDETTSPRTARHRLVEYNVVRQVRFLRESLPDGVTTVGYVDDQEGAFGAFPDDRYLVALDGLTDPAAIRARLPEESSVSVASLLS